MTVLDLNGSGYIDLKEFVHGFNGGLEGGFG